MSRRPCQLNGGIIRTECGLRYGKRNRRCKIYLDVIQLCHNGRAAIGYSKADINAGIAQLAFEMIIQRSRVAGRVEDIISVYGWQGYFGAAVVVNNVIERIAGVVVMNVTTVDGECASRGGVITISYVQAVNV